MSIPKFLLLENFSWLLSQLASFSDPSITYKRQGRPDIVGGNRRIYRYNKHYNIYYKQSVISKQNKQVVDFGDSKIECDKWEITHKPFTDDELKEKYPVPDSGSYIVMITSKDSLKNNTASRYYVSCNCMDFFTTFKQKLIDTGYTNDDGTLPSATGAKKLAPAICKHIYAVLLREYSDIINTEGSATESAEIAHPTLPASANNVKVNTNKKEQYANAIRSTLKFFNNTMPNNPDVYKDIRRDNAYKKYKFMVKSNVAGGYGGWIIVFTNPLLNPFRDKLKNKELVPVLAGNKSKLLNYGDALVIYTRYFTKDELMQFIRDESREIQQNQIDKLNKTVGKYSLTESLECVDNSLKSMFMEYI